MLKKDLIDYFGTAMFSGNPVAMMELELLNVLHQINKKEYIKIRTIKKNSF